MTHTFSRQFVLDVIIVLLGTVAGQGAGLDSKTDSASSPTLAHHLSTNLAARAVGHSPEENMGALLNWHYGVYTNGNLGAFTNSVWATNFWLHGVRGLSATCIGCSNGMGGQGLVTMVTPRHYLFATHMHPEGYLLAFLDTNNVIHWRRTLQRVDVIVPFPTKAPMDTSVGILNEDLPPSVGFLPVLATNFAKYLAEDNKQVIQGVGMNQDMKIFSQPMGLGDPPFVVWNSRAQSPFGPSRIWNVGLRSGDSSNPEMLLIGDQLVLISHNFSILGGPNYAYLFGAINQTMHELSTHNHLHSDYQLTPFSLADWPPLANSAK